MSEMPSTQPAWIHDLTTIAAIALPEAWADEFGTTVNGMWARPDGWTPAAVEAAHAKGRRILVSVPLIALTHQVYEDPNRRHLLDEVCRDVNGDPAEVEWYYWDAKPVWSLCIHSPVLRAYLVDTLREAIAAGVDVVNVDEINTSVGLMTNRPKGSGFCRLCLGGSAVIAAEARRRGVEPADNEARTWLREDHELYDAFAEEQQERAFCAAADLLDELRGIAREHGRMTAITANVAGLGAFVGHHGALWSAMWGELLDVIMLEAIYVVSRSQFEDPHAHKLLPRGKFAPLYRLGRAIGPRAPIWIAPQINVPRQLAGQKRQRYYELMFLEAYANLGRWGYNWWPGVDDAARREATAPEAIKGWTNFLRSHPDLYTGLRTENAVAVVYANSAVLAEPQTHYRYLGVAQALYEAGVQYDVIYTGDDRFAPAPLDAPALAAYRTLVVPGIDHLSPSQQAAIRAFEAGGGSVIGMDASCALGDLVDRFWTSYADDDREAVLRGLALDDATRVDVSAARVVATRYVTHDHRIAIHLLNYDYREVGDLVEPARGFKVRLPWAGRSSPSAALVSPAGIRELNTRAVDGQLEVKVPELRDHAVLVLTE